MAALKDILKFITEELNSTDYPDASLNGLQLEGNSSVSTIASSVDSGLSIVKSAAEKKADLLLVHHGMFWGSPLAIKDSHKEIVKTLLDSNLSLVAQHLPLDASEKYGNNYSLARLIEISDLAPAAFYKGKAIGCVGENSKKLPFTFFVDALKQKLEGASSFSSLNFGPKIPKKICIVSGSAADQLYQFKEEGFDTFITGEPKQFAYHFCKDNGINAIFAGHYATETLGVKNLAEATAKRFNLKHVFINHPTGI